MIRRREDPGVKLRKANLSREQAIAARQALGWSQEKMAAKADLDARTIANLEGGAAQPSVRSLRKIQRALEEAGVEFVEAEPGVKLTARP
jgi:transcriptional regulator with XRE-family HTH domain